MTTMFTRKLTSSSGFVERRGIDLRQIILLISTTFLFACAKTTENAPLINEEGKQTCKTFPAQIWYGRDRHYIEYDVHNKPVKLTTEIYNPKVPWEEPARTKYIIEYNAQLRPGKISKYLSDKVVKYFLLEYGANGQLTDQAGYYTLGKLIGHTRPEYSKDGLITTVSTEEEGSAQKLTASYKYENGNLVKKTLTNLYNPNAKEFYDADFTYTYYQDKELKIKPFFEGPVGLLFLADIAGSATLHFMPDGNGERIFEAQETTANKNMLKNIRIIAFHNNARDTTNISYEYEYDSEGFPVLQKGLFQNIMRRYEQTPFGVPILITSPRKVSFNSTIGLYCE
jgi:hypothetical protein